MFVSLQGKNEKKIPNQSLFNSIICWFITIEQMIDYNTFDLELTFFSLVFFPWIFQYQRLSSSSFGMESGICTYSNVLSLVDLFGRKRSGDCICKQIQSITSLYYSTVDIGSRLKGHNIYLRSISNLIIFFSLYRTGSSFPEG